MDARNKKNPLFVVTNDGKDVQQAEGLWDAIVKKLHLQPLIDFFNILYELLLENMHNYAWFNAIKNRINQVLEAFFEIFKYLKVIPN